MGREKIGSTLKAWLAEEPLDFAVTAVGVGTAGIITGKVREWLPTEGVTGLTDEVLQAISGLLLVNYGRKVHPQLRNFGKGVLYELVGRKAHEWIAPKLELEVPITPTGVPLRGATFPLARGTAVDRI